MQFLPHKKDCIYITKTSQLMLVREAIAVYCETLIRYVGKMQISLILKLVAHTVLCGLIRGFSHIYQVFYEEELDVPLVLFDEVLDHVLRIDRIFRQPQGHLLLIGVSGAGKTTLSRFVAWMNGLSIFQIKVCML